MKNLFTAVIALLTIALTTATTNAVTIEVLVTSGGATDVCRYGNGGASPNTGTLAAPSGTFAWTTDIYGEQTTDDPHQGRKDMISLRGNEDGPNTPNTWGVCGGGYNPTTHPGEHGVGLDGEGATGF